MRKLRKLFDDVFKKSASVFYDYPKSTLVAVLLLTITFASQLPKMELDLSAEGLLHKTDPALVEYNKFRDQFGREGFIIVPIKTQNIFDIEFLKKLKSFHEEIEEKVPHVEEVKSILNARNAYGQEDSLIVEEMFENWPEKAEDMEPIKSRVMKNELFHNLLFSENLEYTAVLIETKAYSSVGHNEDILSDFEDNFEKSVSTTTGNNHNKYLTNKESNEAVKAVLAVAEKFDAPDFHLQVGGMPVVVYFLKTTLVKEVAIFMGATLFLIFILLYVLFKRMSGVALPLLIVILSVISTFGVMALLNIAFKLPTQVLPSFLIAVGVGDSVHILRIFYMRLNECQGNKKEAIMLAFEHSGIAVLLTSLTTAIALFTFISAKVDPVADMGITASIGVMIAFFYTIFLLPSFIAILPIKARDQVGKQKKSTLIDRFLSVICRITINHPHKTFVVSLIIVICAATGILKVQFQYFPLLYFKENHALRKATQVIDNNLSGTISIEAIIDTEKKNGLFDPGLLNRIEKSIEYIKTIECGQLSVGKAWSMTSVIKEIHQALNENRGVLSVSMREKIFWLG